MNTAPFGLRTYAVNTSAPFIARIREPSISIGSAGNDPPDPRRFS